MKEGENITAAVRRKLREEIGWVRMMEWRNALLKAPTVPLMRRREDTEVSRARKLYGPALPGAQVACIVPTYKRPAQLLNAVESILNQTYSDFVAIVIDDGAGLPALPPDPRLTAISLSRNLGAAGIVRNVGIRTSTSRYIAFLDDDNTWRSDHLSHCVAALEAGADLVYTAVARRTPSGRELDILSAPFDRRAFMQESWIDTSGIAIRRSSKVHFSRLPRGRNTIPGEDWEFVFRLSRGAHVVHIPEVTVDYLVNPESFYTPWTETATR